MQNAGMRDRANRAFVTGKFGVSGVYVDGLDDTDK